MSTVYQGGVLRFTAAAGPGLGRRCGFGATRSQPTRVAVSASVARSHPTSSCHRTREPQERRITERPDRAWALVTDSRVPLPRAHRLDDVAVLVEHQVRLVEPGPTTTRPTRNHLDHRTEVTPAIGSSGMASRRPDSSQVASGTAPPVYQGVAPGDDRHAMVQITHQVRSERRAPGMGASVNRQAGSV
jgi:hypothetical protein